MVNPNADEQAITDMLASLAGDYAGAIEFSTFLGEFQGAATQLKGNALAVEWYRAGVSATDAAAWASAGNTPTGAAPLIADGITPQMAAEADAALGGSTLERIAFIADQGIDTTGVDLSALDDE